MKNSQYSHRILILTQKVDINDDVLGFMHGWIAEFAKHCEKLTVIALGVGEYNLPENVKVLSLGKEVASSQYSVSSIKKRLKYILNFYKYIWSERKNYDAVFVHMNPEYVVLGGILWRLWGKKVALWNNHIKGNYEAWLAFKISHITFYTSPFSFNARVSGKKGNIMPAGIDTDTFKARSTKHEARNSVLFLGRISPVKRLEVLIRAMNQLDEEEVDFVLSIAGEAPEKDIEYFNEIKKLSENLEKKGKIKFVGKVPNYKAPEIYSQNEIFVNLTNPGSLDKTILEAMACGTLAIVSNQSFKGILPEELIFEENNPEDLKKKIIALLKKDEKEKEELRGKLRDYVVKNHSLNSLIPKILYE